MKNQFALFLFFLSHSIQLFAQDTIRSQDMPKVGDVFVVSTGSTFAGIEPAETGFNFNWDFSQLARTGQRIDTMINPATTNPLLAFYFIDNILNTNRANLASSGQNFNLGFTGLTDVFNYYYNSSTEFKQPGLGAVINSVPIPVFYVPHDVIYKFPLTIDNEDSVFYSYEVDLSSTIGIYYHVNRWRHNIVDGWGTLKTPYGTFDVLRVHSKIVQEDSTFITQLNIGTKLPPVTTHEYKWLGAGFGLPLLQINTSENDTIVNQILYQDSIHLTGISNVNPIINEVSIFPNPASDRIIIRYAMLEKSNVKIELFSMEGKKIFSLVDKSQAVGINFKEIDLKGYNLAIGNYIIELQAGNSALAQKLHIRKN